MEEVKLVFSGSIAQFISESSEISLLFICSYVLFCGWGGFFLKLEDNQTNE